MADKKQATKDRLLEELIKEAPVMDTAIAELDLEGPKRVVQCKKNY